MPEKATTPTKLGCIVLCGGKSSRMGRPKLALPFGEELLLQRVIRIVSEVAGPIVVVAAQGQALPSLPPSTWIVRDQHEERGPLEGLAAGLRCVVQNRLCEAVYATSCDVPLLAPAFIRQLQTSLSPDVQAVVPVEEKFFHPLAAIYRAEVLETVQKLLAKEQMRPAFLFQEVPTCRVPVETLRQGDPELHSLLNCNRWEDYLAALSIAGLSLPTDGA